MKYCRKKRGFVYLVLCYTTFVSFYSINNKFNVDPKVSSRTDDVLSDSSEYDSIANNGVDNLLNHGNISRDCFLNLSDVSFLNNSQKQFSEFSKKNIKSLLIAEKKANFVEGRIENNFYLSASKAGLPNNVIRSFCNIFKTRINFKNSLQKGDSFSVAYDSSNNRILYAKIKNRKHEFSAYAYHVNGKTEYLMGNGEPVVSGGNEFFKLPIPGARISSHYGRRRHPVFGIEKNHSGVDFAAGYGTPVRCAGSGYISDVGFDYGYGRYIIVSHANGYKTRYAHLSKSHVKKGQKVEGGSVIGAVGSSGVSTGPHLHFELVRNGVRMNPLSRVKLAATPKLCGAKLYKFIAFKNSIDRSISSVVSSNEI